VGLISPHGYDVRVDSYQLKCFHHSSIGASIAQVSEIQTWFGLFEKLQQRGTKRRIMHTYVVEMQAQEAKAIC